VELGLNGRRVLVTGGSQGIGYAVAKGFLEEGAQVAIVARDPTRLREASARLAAIGNGRVAAKSVDLAAAGVAAALADEFPDTDILVNNAGAVPTGDIFDIDEKRWREAWELKVFGFVNLSRAMYAHMRGRPPKVIINVMGTGAERPQWRYVCGNAANIALNGFTKSLGGRSIDDGIRVVGVNPGAVETERWRGIHMRRAEKILGDASRWREVLNPDQPLNRAGKPEEISNVILFLASERASWVCGEVVNVDGGKLHRDNWF
jgi:NAD(P)-dependent dehydrogenase (short-subunit alcohol dehydrogenase family)